MAEPKPQPLCNNCDHICEQSPDLNPDQECWGRMTSQERLEVGLAIIAEHIEDLVVPKE